MRRLPGSPLIACGLALLAALLYASPAEAASLAPETPRSPNAEAITTTWWVMLIAAGVLLVAIHGALIAAAVRFRARRGRRPASTAAGRGALRLPLAGLGLLAVAVLVFGVVMTADVREVADSGPDGLESAGTQTAQVGVSGLPAGDPLAEPPEEGDDPAAAAPLEINVIGQQWVWRFEYPGGQPGQQVFSYGELVVPVDTTVILNVSSVDVAHTWWVPALGGQVQALPGSVSQTWFKADREGRYPGRSTTFSGTGFPSMRAWVRVVGVSEYLDHVEQLEEDLRDAQSAVAGDEDDAAAEDEAAGEDGAGGDQGPGAADGTGEEAP